MKKAILAFALALGIVTTAVGISYVLDRGIPEAKAACTTCG